MKVMENLQSKDTECMAICTWVTALSHWTGSIKNAQKPILQAVESGFVTGDPLYTAIAIANVFGLALCVGDNLGELERSMRNTYSQLCDLSRRAMLLWAQPPFQFVLNYRIDDTNWRALTNLTGEIMNEVRHYHKILVFTARQDMKTLINHSFCFTYAQGEYMREAVDANHPILVVIAMLYKAQLCLNFGYTPQAEDLYTECTKRGKVFRYNYAANHFYFYGCLTFYQRYRESGHRKHLKMARKWQRGLKRIDSRGSPNVRFLTLLEAEETNALKSAKLNDIISAYDTAIAVMKKEKNVSKEALANERAGFALAHLGRREEALGYFEHAMQLYRYDWGAPTKFEWLQEKVIAMGLRRKGDEGEKRGVGDFPEQIH